MKEEYYKKLLKLLKKAVRQNETPVAALIEYNGKIISKGYNKRNKSKKTIDHAEIIAITKANKKIKEWRLNKCTLYVTVEPCEMCKNIIKEARINKVYYLIPKEDIKKQYNKTIFSKISSKDDNQKIKSIMTNFWQNKRNK